MKQLHTTITFQAGENDSLAAIIDEVRKIFQASKLTREIIGAIDFKSDAAIMTPDFVAVVVTDKNEPDETAPVYTFSINGSAMFHHNGVSSHFCIKEKRVCQIADKCVILNPIN